MFASSDKEVSNIINDNLEYFADNPDLFKYVKNAKRRISRIKREKYKSWKFQLN